MKKEILISVKWLVIAILLTASIVSCGTVHCDAYGHNDIENGILSENEASS